MQEPQIIYEDNELAVISKPAGWIVNRADTTVGQKTIQEWAEENLDITKNFRDDDETDFTKRGGVVHRLDKETSGILLIAKNPASFASLQSQFKERIVKKQYTTLVHGNIVEEEGAIDEPIGRLPWNRTKFGILPEGREAHTKFKVLKRGNIEIGKENVGFTLIEVYPETGRTHQIRVHLRHIGYPVFGDMLYAGRKNAKKERKLLPRQFLHASKITFMHPVYEKEVSFEAPLFKELQDLLLLLT